MNQKFECAVVGGGAAGLSAALVLGRARRRTLVIDAGGQSNLPAHGIGGLLGHDGRSPAELYEIGRGELEKYPSVRFIEGTVDRVAESDGGFDLTIAGEQTVTGSRLILAGGMEYEFADLPGAGQLWGNTVFHCPFCHGWEVEGKPLAVRGNAARGLHGALLLRAWSDDVVLLTDGPAELDEDQAAKLEAAGVRVEQREITGLVAGDGELKAIRFADGEALERSGLLVAPRLRQRSAIVEQLGLKLVEDHPMFEDAPEVDNFQRTSLPGVFAAGDQGGQMPQVAAAISTGSMAGAFVVQDLLNEKFGLPLPG